MVRKRERESVVLKGKWVVEGCRHILGGVRFVCSTSGLYTTDRVADMQTAFKSSVIDY